MNRISKFLFSMIIAGLGLSVAHAQQQPGPGAQGQGPGMMGQGMSGPHGGPGMKGGKYGGDPVAAIESRLGTLKTDLKITTAQEPAWSKFQDAAKQQGQTLAKLVTQSPAKTAPERMDQYTNLMKQNLVGMERTTGAFKELYGALAPEQKAVADREFAQRHAPGLMGRHWDR